MPASLFECSSNCPVRMWAGKRGLVKGAIAEGDIDKVEALAKAQGLVYQGSCTYPEHAGKQVEERQCYTEPFGTRDEKSPVTVYATPAPAEK